MFVCVCVFVILRVVCRELRLNSVFDKLFWWVSRKLHASDLYVGDCKQLFLLDYALELDYNSLFSKLLATPWASPRKKCESSPSSQTSVSILAASAALGRFWEVCEFVDDCLQQLIGCMDRSLAFTLATKNGASRICGSTNKFGVVSTTSSKSIISDDESDNDDFFKCWPVNASKAEISTRFIKNRAAVRKCEIRLEASKLPSSAHTNTRTQCSR